MTDTCRACAAQTTPFETGRVLDGIEVDYELCARCGMVQAVDPSWLDQAYSDAIAKLDIGLLDRCQILANVTAMVVRGQRLREGRFLDWAGGYGTLTRLMRDRGFDFVHHDPMAANVFAEGHEVSDFGNERFAMVTAFEVLEHLVDPVDALGPVASVSDLLLCTTHLLPEPVPRPGEWWYYTPESGQHVSFYTSESLRILAERLGYDGVVAGSFVHLFHRGPVSRRTRALVRRPAVAYAAGLLSSLADRRRSLLDADVEQVKAS